MKKISELLTREDLALYLAIPLQKLTYILYKNKPDSYYSTFEIPKKNGEPRQIHAPSGDLKQLQKKLAQKLWSVHREFIEENQIQDNISHAFQKEKSILTNASIHKNKRYVLNLDLKDFFDHFHFGRVRGFFMKNKNFELPVEIATMLAQLTCYQGKLPQGAPTSPVITNLICNILDMRLLNIAKKYRVVYTRYADAFYRHGTFEICSEEGSINQLEGRFSFINQIDCYNNKNDLEQNIRFGR